MNQKFAAFASVLFMFLLSDCGGGAGGSGAPETPTPSPERELYQPLSTGNSWTYTCHNTQNQNEQPYTIRNAVLGTTAVNGQNVYELSMQIPSSPSQSTTIVELIANDAQANTWIYGYLVNGSVQAILPAEVVAWSPGEKGTAYNYTGLNGTTVDRVFEGIESSSPTPLGTFTVAPYFESGGTHNYGYAFNTGIVEEDHGPNFQYNCLLTTMNLR